LVLHGKAAGRPEIRQAVETIRQDGHRIDVRVTWEAGDTQRYAKEAVAQGVDTIVAGGGDGSLNEVVSGTLEVVGQGAGERGCLFGASRCDGLRGHQQRNENENPGSRAH
jgi:predicted polyphosphate/ATP-dependent NAD kinase